MVSAKGQILIVNQHNNSWSFPKGHVESGEELIDAARREIKEESGINELELVKQFDPYDRFRIGLDPKTEDRSVVRTMNFFLFKTTQTALSPQDPDNPEARWVDREDVAELLTHPKDKDFFLKIKDIL